ncbi:MAG: phosphate transport system regulatory protein PhoU, partial [Calditrichaeota bacterium]|nr:phosphate transport system regulatory protein PhoU [Calditrichota bacterium]
RRVIESDQEIDRMEVNIEDQILTLLALQQPVAIDLRFIISGLKMNNDL